MSLTYLKDELRVGGSHLLDIHSTLRASNHDWAVAGPIHQDGEVGLAADIQGLGHHHLAVAQQGKRKRRGEFCNSALAQSCPDSSG